MIPLPDDATVTLTVGQLRALIEGRTSATFDGVGTREAAEITGEDPRSLRRLWARWERIQADGGRPEVRVSRKSGAERSDLLFHRPDLEAYRRAHAPDEDTIPFPTPEPTGDPNDVEGIVEKLLSGE